MTPTETLEIADRATSRRNWLTLTICISAVFMTTLDTTILNVALPTLQKGLHASAAGLQWSVDGYLLTRACALVLCGSLGDRFGRRFIFTLGLVVFTTTSLGCGLAPNLEILVGFRLIQGIGGAMMVPSSLGIVVNTFSDRRSRAKALGFWSASVGVSSTLGPILGGVLVQYAGWRSVFWVNVPVGILAISGTRLLHESKAGVARRFDIPGQTAITLALAGLTYGLIDGPDAGWNAPVVLGCLIGSVIMWIAFVKIELGSDTPLLDVRIFSKPALSGSVVITLCSFIALGGVLFFNTLYLQEVRGFTPLHAGLLTIPMTATGFFAAPVAGRMLASRGPLLPVNLSGIFTLAAMLVLTVMLTPTTSIAILLLAYLLFGVGAGLVNPPVTNAAINSLPSDQASVAGSITSTARQVGSNLGVALIGSIVFSIAASGAVIHAQGRITGAAALSFSSALRYGYGVTALLTLGYTAVSMWCFSPRRTAPKSTPGPPNLAEPSRA